MSPCIPPEITDNIISAVALDDYTAAKLKSHTLAMCALVCRAWLPKSRAQLFEDICVPDERTYDLLVERVVRSETMSPYLAFVNRLYLDGFAGPYRLGEVARSFFVEFAGKLPGLRTLDVYNIHLTHQQPSVRWPLLLSQFRTITSLTFWNCEFSSFNDVRRLLTALPLLSTLGICDLTWPTVSHELHLQTTPRRRTYWPELRELRILYMLPQCAAVFLRWIAAALDGPGSPVKVLRCDFSRFPSTGPLQQAVDAFMGRVWPSVTDLDIRMIDAPTLLSGFTTLERLSYDLLDYQGNWEGVASVLQGGSSKTIQSITFSSVFTTQRRRSESATLTPQSVNHTNRLHFDDDTLEELDRVLSCEPFGRLQEVVLDVLADEEEEEELLRAHARRCLSELHKQKIPRLYINGVLQCLDVD